MAELNRRLMWVTGLDTVTDGVVGPIRFEPADHTVGDSTYWHQQERWGRVRDKIKELGMWEYGNAATVSEQALGAIDTLHKAKEAGYKRANELSVERDNLKRKLRDCKDGAYKVGAARVTNRWSERQHDDNMGVLKEKLVQLGQRQEGTWIAANAVTALDMFDRDNKAKAENIRTQRQRIRELADATVLAQDKLARAEHKLALVDVVDIEATRKALAESRRACKELREQRDAANRSREALYAQVVAAKNKPHGAQAAREIGRLQDTLRVQDARIDRLSRIVQEAKAKLDAAGVTFTGTNYTAQAARGPSSDHVTLDESNYQAQADWDAANPYPIHAPEDMCAVCDARRKRADQRPPWDRA